MSNKLTCPVCDTHSSAVYTAVMIEGGNCPVCGAPGEIIDRVDQLQHTRADEGLKAELTRALADLAKIRADRDRLARIVEGVRGALLLDPGE